LKIIDLLSDVTKTMPLITENITDKSAEVSFITDDSLRVERGCLFVCVKGERFDGHERARAALDKGAAAVVTERDLGVGNQITVKNSRVFYGLLCAAFYNHPERKLKLIGITGTNGKTTIAEMIRGILSANGRKTGFIGTTGITIDGAPVKGDESTPTTPRAAELYELFDRMVRENCEYVVMEVSSFALSQNRIGPAVFKAAVFTNLTQDHLDYHKTMENYFEAKKLLFTEHCEAAFICIDDEYGLKLREILRSEYAIPNYSYGFKDGADIHAGNIKNNGKATFWLTVNKRSYPVSLDMPGAYNISNAAAAVAVCDYIGIGAAAAVNTLESFGGVSGRCEVLSKKRGFTVMRDYAHSPDGVEKMLSGIRDCFKGRIICLFGCGGSRDRDKRPKMGRIAEKYADYLIITSDNPRNEEPDAIIDDIITGLKGEKPYIREADRYSAILRAITMAQVGDIVVLLGKGHETYQVIGVQRLPFDEKLIVNKIMKNYKALPFNPDIKETMTIEEIAEAVGGKLSGIKSSAQKITAGDIFSDTRAPVNGGLFTAIKGENFDGHDFLESAVQGGAAAVLTEKALPGLPCITVKDTRSALLSLARSYRERFTPIIVGITGSVGKTTTKEMISLALSGGHSVYKSKGNFNNEIGLPFQVLKLNRSCTAAVIEMGMSNYGEIERLSKTVRPDICVITNIGWSHIENLGSKAGILKAKLEILKGAKENAPLIINGDNKLLLSVADNYPERSVVTYGIDCRRADYRAVNIRTFPNKTIFNIKNGEKEIAEVILYCAGRHNILNALCSVTTAVLCGCEPTFAAKLLSGYTPSGMRQEIKSVNGHTVILDCYNASPDSMTAAIDMLDDTPVEKGGKRVAVLGDMLELGELSKDLHEQIGEYISGKKNIDALFCYGEKAAYIAWKSGMKAIYSNDKEYIADHIRACINPGDVILFKASRGMKLEEVFHAVLD